MNNAQLRGTPFQSAAGTTTASLAITGGTVTITVAKSGQNIYITDINCSGDAPAGSVSVTDNGTFLWGARIGTNGQVNSDFITPLKATSGTVVLQASGSTTVYASIAGYSL